MRINFPIPWSKHWDPLYFKRTIQTVTHFLSWVVYGGIMVLFIGPGVGAVSAAIRRDARQRSRRQ